MRIAYANAYYELNNGGGGNVHIDQFITNAVALGHEIWCWPGNDHPAARILSTSTMKLWKTLRKMDALYIRLERTPPSTCRWSVLPHRLLYGFPVIVWEFNTVPEYGLLRGQSEAQVEQAIRAFRHYGKGCDLAVCVSQSIAEYVKNNLGIKRVLVVPNGSDPDLFQPDLPPVRRIPPDPERLQVVWIGSGDIAWHDFDLLREAAWFLWDGDEHGRVVFHLIGADLMGVMNEMPPNVHYYGAEKYERLPHWLAAMDVGLCLYRPGPGEFSSPLKLFDYMSSGLVVVSTKQPQVFEVFEKMGQTDLLIPSDDPRSLAEKLKYLAADRERVRRQGAAGRQLVINYYNWRRAVQVTMREIASLLKQKKEHSHTRIV